MTYNIRLNAASDGPNRWDLRKESMADFIRLQQPSVLGLQEVLPEQLDYLVEQLPGYGWYGVGREDGKRKGEFSPVFYDSSRFSMVLAFTRWLSATPETPGKGWDAACERVATFLALRDKRTGDTLLAINTHWDHIGQTARLESARLILKEVENLTRKIRQSLPVMFVGDLNTEPGSAPIAEITRRFADACPPEKTTEGTFNGFDLSRTTFPRIDYIWTIRLKATHYHVLCPLINGHHVSDHFAVAATLGLQD